jgi:hypothetical protein
MSAHTPGPWCVRDLPTAQRYIGPSNDGGAPSVAFVLSRVNVPNERLDADARLIAAAPDLLAALQGLHDDVADYIKLNNLGGYDNHWMLAARAAIATATGGTP